MRKFCLFSICFFLPKILLAVSPGGEIFDFLKIVPSAYLQSTGGFNASWPQKSDVLLLNPAAAPQVHPGYFQFNSGYLGEGFLDTNFLVGFNSYRKDFFTVSVDYLTIYADKPLRTVADTSQPDGYSVLGEINPYFYNLGFGWAKKIKEHTSFGARLKFIGQKLDEKKYSGVALDAGILYHPVSDISRERALTDEIWNVGLGIINLGPEVSGYSLPAGGYLNFSRIVSRRLTFGLGGVYYLSETGEINSGLSILVFPGFSLNFGYSYPLKNDNLVKQFYERFRGGFSFSFGAIGINYAFVPQGNLGNNHFLGVLWRN